MTDDHDNVIRFPHCARRVDDLDAELRLRDRRDPLDERNFATSLPNGSYTEVAP
jgi:hypothetical protein